MTIKKLNYPKDIMICNKCRTNISYQNYYEVKLLDNQYIWFMFIPIKINNNKQILHYHLRCLDPTRFEPFDIGKFNKIIINRKYRGE